MINLNLTSAESQEPKKGFDKKNTDSFTVTTAKSFKCLINIKSHQDRNLDGSNSIVKRLTFLPERCRLNLTGSTRFNVHV